MQTPPFLHGFIGKHFDSPEDDKIRYVKAGRMQTCA